MCTYEIISKGFPGNNSSQLLELFDDAVAPLMPDVVVVMVGTNDCLNTFNLKSLAEYEANLASLIERIEKLGAVAIICTILPCAAVEVLERHDAGKYRDANPEAAVIDLNEVIRNTVAGYSSAILIDLYREFENADWKGRGLIRTRQNCGQSDGVHPTPAGYELMAACVCEGIRAAKLAGRTIVCLGDSITFGVHVDGAGTASGQTYPGRLKELLEINFR